LNRSSSGAAQEDYRPKSQRSETPEVFVTSPALRRALEKYDERDWLGGARGQADFDGDSERCITEHA
jgi:hypothetical protein